MPSDSTVAEVVTPEVNVAATVTDISKRNAANGGAQVEEPPLKKVRLENNLDPNEQDHSNDLRGIAPIKAE